MNNSELDAKLKAAREPALPPEYKEAFTKSVLMNLRSSPWKSGRQGHQGMGRWVWGMATAACILIAFAVGHWQGKHESSSGPDILANARLVEETLAMFPNRVRAIVKDERGLNVVLSDQDTLPASSPIYVRICDGTNCASLVTFSGQEILIGGQKLTVLAQPDGGIIVAGNRFVWSSADPVYAGRKLKIEARNLDLNSTL